MIKNELKEIKNVILWLGAEIPELWDELQMNKSDVHRDVVYQEEKSKEKKKK
jgi:hypothetical protein